MVEFSLSQFFAINEPAIVSGWIFHSGAINAVVLVILKPSLSAVGVLNGRAICSMLLVLVVTGLKVELALVAVVVVLVLQVVLS